MITFRRTSENLLPKALLQDCLRPMLFSYRDLSIEGFKGLSRLLSLVSSCVATTLSERLLRYGPWHSSSSFHQVFLKSTGVP